VCDGAEMAIFLSPVFAASCMQRISDLHSKFTLRPHHVLRLGEEKNKKKKERNRMKI